MKEDKFYLPEDWKDIKFETDKYIDLDGWKINSWFGALAKYTEIGNWLYHNSLNELTPILGRKRAKESARFFKTYNSQITCDVMFNMRSFHNFLTQRLDSHAQLEIQEIAKEMLNLVKNIEGNPFEHTLNAWNL